MTAKAAKTTKALAKKKTTKALARRNTAKKKTTGKKIAVAKKRPKTAVATQTKSVTKKPVAKAPAQSASGTKAAAPPETLSHKIADAVGAVVDIFTDAERL
ncbi:MAG: hypothetical protein WAK32_15785, partial [Xanthobacteraceae bacterium]